MQTALTGTRVGAVDWFCPKRGYGFVKDLISQCSLFVHHSSIARSSVGWCVLHPGELVLFNCIADLAGRPCARFVTGVKRGPLRCELDDYSQ